MLPNYRGLETNPDSAIVDLVQVSGDETLIGVYETTKNIVDNCLVITDKGIYIVLQRQAQYIPYTAILELDSHDSIQELIDSPELRILRIRIQDGTQVSIEIPGTQLSPLDVKSLHSFILNVKALLSRHI